MVLGKLVLGGVDFSGASEQCSFGSGVVLFGGDFRKCIIFVGSVLVGSALGGEFLEV